MGPLHLLSPESRPGLRPSAWPTWETAEISYLEPPPPSASPRLPSQACCTWKADSPAAPEVPVQGTARAGNVGSEAGSDGRGSHSQWLFRAAPLPFLSRKHQLSELTSLSSPLIPPPVRFPGLSWILNFQGTHSRPHLARLFPPRLQVCYELSCSLPNSYGSPNPQELRVGPYLGTGSLQRY